MTRPISDPRSLEPAWTAQYARLSRHFVSLLPKHGVAVEIGCGEGQLTIPLAERVPQIRIIGVDNFMGPYSGGHKVLSAALSGRAVKARVKIVASDYQVWLRQQPDLRYEAILSSEFLPEIDSKRMRSFLVDCHRVLKLGGRTVHSFLSSVPRNERQRRLIEADTDPRWTKTPPAEWFSPTPIQVLKTLKVAGFERPRVKQLRSGLIIRSNAARQLLRDWDIRQVYWKSHRMELENEGFEIPDWMIVSAFKPP